MENSPKRLSNGYTVVEILVAIAVLTAVAALIIANVGSSIEKSKMAKAKIIQNNLQNTYSQWVQMGGTHDDGSGGLSGSEFTYNTPAGDHSEEIVVEVLDISEPQYNPSYQTQIGIRATFTNPSATSDQSSQLHANIIKSDGRGLHSFGISNYGSNPSDSGSYRLDQGETLKLWVVAVNGSPVTYDILTVPAWNNTDVQAKLTKSLWDHLANTPPLIPTETGAVVKVTDSDNAGLNSSSVRMSDLSETEVSIVSDTEILYQDRYLISFTATSDKSGNWVVTYTP